MYLDFTLHLLDEATTNRVNPFASLLMLIPFMALMYFTILRPEKKRRKQEQEMRDSVQIGDEITTLGGIMGRVVTIKEDSLVIETGSDRNKIKIARWGIQTNNTAEERLQAEKEAAAAAKAAEKQAAAEALKEKKKKK
ncbi:MAG TPA: preprotein translocase subunit YajC [Clostridiales bacterium]|nr:preprotein translocase subunit YajC [Clostridiales bacterium]HPU67198.1 preprotein translocase subunit YajC [Clostridiales bacterium]HQD72338.1 preprotein translocase subunit YajC [Clostridiales bacterium]HXK82806.1 preprotein translocase subunit YajC [Clostridiales bacterium]